MAQSSSQDSPTPYSRNSNGSGPSSEWLLKLLLESNAEMNRSLGRLEALTNGNREIVTARLASLASSLEIRLHHIQQQIATSMRSVPNPAQSQMAPNTPSSMATPTGTPVVKTVAHKIGMEALVWFLGKLWAMAYPLLLPGLAFIGALLWKSLGLGQLWKFLTG